MLKKLQQSKSKYNVFNWEMERKTTEKLIKNIQYHKPGSSPLPGVKRNERRTNTADGGA